MFKLEKNVNKKCDKAHLNECPDFEEAQKCPRGSKCPLMHRKKNVGAHKKLLIELARPILDKSEEKTQEVCEEKDFIQFKFDRKKVEALKVDEKRDDEIIDVVKTVELTGRNYEVNLRIMLNDMPTKIGLYPSSHMILYFYFKINLNFNVIIK